MLYTVRPLERIFAAPETFNQKKANTQKNEVESEYQEVMLANGRIVTRRDGENYVIESINSTDMKDYLNEAYIPGNNISRNK